MSPTAPVITSTVGAQTPHDASLRLGRRHVEALGGNRGVEVEVAEESALSQPCGNPNICMTIRASAGQNPAFAGFGAETKWVLTVIARSAKPLFVGSIPTRASN
jgi:hypothetical protein